MIHAHAHLAVDLKNSDYDWTPLEPLPAKSAPWKPGQLFKPELLNADHREWARQYADACAASPEWRADQERREQEQAERKRAREERLAERRQRPSKAA